MLFVGVFFSCKKDENQELIKNNSWSYDKNKLIKCFHNGSASKGILDDDSTFMANLSENLDSIGSWHNEFQDYLYQNTIAHNLSMCEKENFRKNFNIYCKNYFATKGIKSPDDFVTFYNYSKMNEMIVYPQPILSEYANKLLQQLNDMIKTADQLDIQEFADSCDKLKKICISSSLKVNEKLIVGSGVAVAKYSLLYWNKNYSAWKNYYSSMSCSFGLSGKPSPTEISVLQHDVAGVIGGAIGGGLGGGPAGIVAGALVVGGYKSATHALCQAFHITSVTD